MINLAKYAGLKICVAVSGGRDSMALLHYLNIHAVEYGITLSALNCDHRIRGEASKRDSEFVKKWCKANEIPLLTFVWKDYETEKKIFCGSIESRARSWRIGCYSKAMRQHCLPDGTQWQGADAVATAHHLNDNAETVLFNLARGTALAGMKGITDNRRYGCDGLSELYLIHPLIECTREQIDRYVSENCVPFVEDESNFTDNYTRNKIRHKVIPNLEEAVPDAVKSIYRFSRLAAEDEEYFDRLIERNGLVKLTQFGAEVAFCEEKAIFKRAVLKALSMWRSDIKDYTSEHLERLYKLQFSENGKQFEFLNITVFKENGKIAFCDKTLLNEAVNGCPFRDYESEEYFYADRLLVICEECDLENELQYINKSLKDRLPEKTKLLKFDFGTIPETAVIRFMKSGDKFRKFGGGTKSLGDYFTDKKIPLRLRGQIPLIADGDEVLAVCGVEISDKIKITQKTKKIFYIVCDDYTADKE